MALYLSLYLRQDVSKIIKNNLFNSLIKSFIYLLDQLKILNKAKKGFWGINIK